MLSRFIACANNGVFIQNTLGDALMAYMDANQFLGELHRRSWASGTNIGIGYLGPCWQNWLPQLVYVSGNDLQSFRTIAEYGEFGLLDPASRWVFAPVRTILGQESINNMQGDQAFREKGLLKGHMNLPNHEALYTCARETLQDLFSEVKARLPAHSDEPYPAMITRLVSMILARSVFGLRTKLEKRHIASSMEIARLITDPWVTTASLKQANVTLNQISDELVNHSLDSIDPEKYIYAHANLAACATTEEKLEKLQHENIASFLLASTNLADMLMKTLVEISRNEHVRTRLLRELAPAGNRYVDIKDLPYLKSITLEAKRFYAPSYIARRTSRPFILKINNQDGKEQVHAVPPYSYLFAPIRPRHMDPRLWDNPEKFDPDRFDPRLPEAREREKSLVTFSHGARSCPAKFGFTDVVIKTVIVEFFRNYKGLALDKPVEQIPIFSINTSWKENYYITELPRSDEEPNFQPRNDGAMTELRYDGPRNDRGRYDKITP